MLNFDFLLLLHIGGCLNNKSFLAKFSTAALNIWPFLLDSLCSIYTNVFAIRFVSVPSEKSQASAHIEKNAALKRVVKMGLKLDLKSTAKSWQHIIPTGLN